MGCSPAHYLFLWDKCGSNVGKWTYGAQEKRQTEHRCLLFKRMLGDASCLSPENFGAPRFLKHV